MSKKETPKSAKSSATAHYTAVLVEDLKDQFRFVTEKVVGLEESLRSQMAQDKAELKQEIGDTRRALDMKIENVRTELKQEIVDTRKVLEMTIENVRVDLSGRIDRINDVVIRHDEEILTLKTASG